MVDRFNPLLDVHRKTRIISSNERAVRVEDLPRFDELPLTPGGARSAWGLFGSDDDIGTINLLTADRVVKARDLIQRGAIFPVNTPIDFFTPSTSPARGGPRHTVIHRDGTVTFDDLLDNYYLQGSSQWDALAHHGYDIDQFYNGATEADILAGRRNTIDRWAERGIVGRAVLLDMLRTRAKLGDPYDPGSRVAFDVNDLEAARELAGVEFRTGDILLIYTGFDEWYRSMPVEERYARFPDRNATFPGLVASEDICRYLWDQHFAAVASDTKAIEVWPRDTTIDPYQNLHSILIGQFGMALGEFLWLRDLADDCANDGRYEMFFSAAPLNIPRGVGSPTNALAIK